MESRYAKLKEDWLLKGWTDVPWTIVNWKSGDYHRLNQDGFYVAQSCDGRTDFGSLAFLPKHITILNRFIDQGIAEECKAGESVQSVQEYRLAKNTLIKGIHWAVTGRCNLKCRHCYMDAPSGQLGELTDGELEIVLNYLVEANITSVSLTGGEPFMNKNLLGLIGRLSEKKIRLVDIYTNGTLISDTILQELRAMHVQPIFRISFDGCGAHDQMRGTPGIEAKVLRAISKIRSAGFGVSVTTSIDKTNIHSLMTTYEKMKELDIYAWGVGRPQPVGCGRGITTGLPLEEMALSCINLLQRWFEDGRPFMIGWRLSIQIAKTVLLARHPRRPRT
nr:radical SAM protein [Desulforamulus aquiferis]